MPEPRIQLLFLNMLSRSSMVYALDSGAGNWGSITYKVAVPKVDVLSYSCYRFLQKVLRSGYRKMLTYYDSHAYRLANLEVKNASIGKTCQGIAWFSRDCL
jgi:hypothetical protein